MFKSGVYNSEMDNSHIIFFELLRVRLRRSHDKRKERQDINRAAQVLAISKGHPCTDETLHLGLGFDLFILLTFKSVVIVI